jgi:hypothetical protein
MVADPLPLLTVDVLTKMTAFWARFMQEPDSIRTTARRAYLRDVAVPLGEEQVSAAMVDMAALAAQYPSVAWALQVAGLTAQQHDTYRIALVSARLTKNATVDGAIQRAVGEVQWATARALQRARLTVQQHEAYRAAFRDAKFTVSALRFAQISPLVDSTVWARYATDSTWYGLPLMANTEVMQWFYQGLQGSALGSNVAFLDEHKDELALLEATGMWSLP